jgi:hypothetical protein
MYIEHLDRKSTPLEQAKLTVETLLTVADKRQADVSNIFEMLSPNEVIHLLRTRQVSPWLLLCSRKFKLFFKDKTTPEQRLIMETLIRPDYWLEKFEKSPKELEAIKHYVEAMNL